MPIFHVRLVWRVPESNWLLFNFGVDEQKHFPGRCYPAILCGKKKGAKHFQWFYYKSCVSKISIWLESKDSVPARAMYAWILHSHNLWAVIVQCVASVGEHGEEPTSKSNRATETVFLKSDMPSIIFVSFITDLTNLTIKTWKTMRYHSTPTRMALIKYKCWWGYKMASTLMYCRWEFYFWKKSLTVSYKGKLTCRLP